MPTEIHKRAGTRSIGDGTGGDKLCQHPAEILLPWRHAEEHAFRAHVPVKSLDIGDGETEFDFSLFNPASRTTAETAPALNRLTIGFIRVSLSGDGIQGEQFRYL